MNNKKVMVLIIFLGISFLNSLGYSLPVKISPLDQPQTKAEKTAQEILSDFVNSYREKAEPDESQIFGIQIQGEGGGEWTVGVEPGKKISLLQGKPLRPTFFFTMDLATLRKIYQGDLNALTAMGRARSSETAPADLQFMEGFSPTPDILGKILPLTFHFFTLGSPEIIPYGEKYSRFIHGGNMVIFYYEQGLRTAWAQIKKGMVINRDE
jgi:putative sterol carrier protein